MNSLKESATERIEYRRSRSWQRFKSIPHYLVELKGVRSYGDFKSWLQFKLPYISTLPSFPIKVTLELTNNCDLGCTYCHRSVMNRQLGAMDFDVLRKIADEISQHPGVHLKIGGLGEPALHKDFANIMVYLRDKNIKRTVYTNGLVLQRFDHEQVLEWRIPHLVLSIDGIDARSFESQRVGGNYEQVKANLQAFYQRRKASALGKNLLEIRQVIVPGETPADLAGFRKTWLQTADTVMFNHVIPSGVAASRDSRGRKCRDIRREMYIRWNGKVPLCGYQYLVTNQEWIADIHHVSIQDAWHHFRLQEVRSLHQRGYDSMPEFCKVCAQTA